MGSARFSFRDKNAPDYNPFGTTYTERQEGILNGTVSLDSIRLTELAVLIRKAANIGDEATRESAELLYCHKKDPDAYFPKYTISEAKEILQRLTPWPIQWN